MSLYENLQRGLLPYLGDRTSVVLEEGLKRLGVKPEQLDIQQAENLLKRLVYRELQTSRSPAQARMLVEDLLSQLRGSGRRGPALAKTQGSMRDALESGLKRFSLYLDWPEVAKLRALVNTIRKDPSSTLVEEGKDILALLEEKLQTALLRQARDLAELKATLARVQSVGGVKVRRLETLVRDIEEAHDAETLAQAEVERARTIALELRKLLESSVIQDPARVTQAGLEVPAGVVDTHDDIKAQPEEEPDVLATEFGFGQLDIDLTPDLAALSAEQQSRIRAIDLAEDRRKLEDLRARYPLLILRPELAREARRLEDSLEAGSPLGESLSTFAAQLKQAEQEALSEARARYEWLAERLRKIGPGLGAKAQPLSSQLSLVWETLQAGALPTGLQGLEESLAALESEAKAAADARERAQRLRGELEALKSEASSAFEAYRGEPKVEAFLGALSYANATEETLQHLREDLSKLLAQLSEGRREEGLMRAGLKAQLQAFPALFTLGAEGEGLEARRLQLLNQAENPGSEANLEDLANQINALAADFAKLVKKRLKELALRGAAWNIVPQGLYQAETAFAEGRIPDPVPLERVLEEAIAGRQREMAEQLNRIEAAALSYRGIGGEVLLERIAKDRAALKSGTPVKIASLEAELAALKQALETLRSEVSRQISDLLNSYERHKSVGGETVARLKPTVSYLQAASDKLAALGAEGLQEVQRTLRGAAELSRQLEVEYQAARSIMEELKVADIESLLGVFEVAPEPSETETARIQQVPAKAEAPKKAAPKAEAAPDLASPKEALARLRMRGVEAIALVKDQSILEGSLPFSPATASLVLQELGSLVSELSTNAARVVVVSLSRSVVLFVPLTGKSLVVLAEKALLSRLLNQVDKLSSQLSAL